MPQIYVSLIFLVADRCHMPPTPANGHVSYDLFGCPLETCAEYTHAFFTCDPEYYLVGYGVAVCIGDGTWNLPVPICEGKY